MTAISASPGPTSGVATSSTCRDLRGSLSRVVRPSNMSTSSLRTTTPRYSSGTGRLANSSAAVSPARIASRISFNANLRRRGGLILPAGNSRGSGCLHQLGEDAGQVLRMQERDRRAHRAVPRPLVDEPDALRLQVAEYAGDVRDAVADVMDARTFRREELAHRRV